MASPVAAMSGVPYKLQDATTTGNGNILAIPPSFRNHTIIITAAAGVNAGAIQIETSNDPADAGTWAPIGGGPIPVVAATDVLSQFAGIFNFIRARISTTISGGGSPSVTVTYEGAKSY
jgi:hypothetical protein